MSTENPIGELAPHLGNAPVPPGVGIGAIALQMAMKYHEINMVSDGALYQQYKLEGRNMRDLHLADVFDTAIKIEAHLMASSDRIAGIVVDAIRGGAEAERICGEIINDAVSAIDGDDFSEVIGEEERKVFAESREEHGDKVAALKAFFTAMEKNDILESECRDFLGDRIDDVAEAIIKGINSPE